MISFQVLGTPIPQPRPQVSTRGGFARAFVARKHPIHAWRKAVHDAAPTTAYAEGALALSVWIYLPRPKSHYGTGRNAGKLKASAPEFPAVRPDLDNYVKGIQDALDGVIWSDDGQVVTISASKLYADSREPGAQIIVTRAEGVAA